MQNTSLGGKLHMKTSQNFYKDLRIQAIVNDQNKQTKKAKSKTHGKLKNKTFLVILFFYLEDVNYL